MTSKDEVHTAWLLSPPEGAPTTTKTVSTRASALSSGVPESHGAQELEECLVRPLVDGYLDLVLSVHVHCDTC